MHKYPLEYRSNYRVDLPARLGGSGSPRPFSDLGRVGTPQSYKLDTGSTQCQRYVNHRAILLGVSLLGMVASFMPWRRVGALNVAGFEVDTGILTLIMFLVSAGIVAAANWRDQLAAGRHIIAEVPTPAQERIGD